MVAKSAIYMRNNDYIVSKWRRYGANLLLAIQVTAKRENFCIWANFQLLGIKRVETSCTCGLWHFNLGYAFSIYNC